MTVLEQRLAHDAENLQSALLIVVNPDRYGGEDALAVKWARSTLAKANYLPLTEERAA